MHWIKKTYDAVGLTQYPVGRNLAALQAGFGGSVILCLDVSGSMASGSRLPQAKDGCRRFISEAIGAGYHVAGLLWNDAVAGHTQLERKRDAVDRLFSSASASGGTNVVPALRQCEQLLARRSGDLVVAIFGDGDLGDRSAAIQEAARLAGHGIRVITCGLGEASAEELNVISTEVGAARRVAGHSGIADAIADMARGLRRR